MLASDLIYAVYKMHDLQVFEVGRTVSFFMHRATELLRLCLLKPRFRTHANHELKALPKASCQSTEKKGSDYLPQYVINEG